MNKVDISAIIIFYEKYQCDDAKKIHAAYKSGLESSGKSYEMIDVVDGNLPNQLEALRKISGSDENVKIVKLGRWFGDATSLEVGFENSNGEKIITLPSFQQVEESEIPRLITEADEADMIVTWRFPRKDSFLNKIQSGFFNWMIKTFVGTKFNDMKSQVRVFKREVLEKIYLYGDQDRFLPLWAWRIGFKVKEVKVKQKKADQRQVLYPVTSYIRRSLEIISMFFLIKFTKKPIRFFGGSGLIIFGAGFLLSIYLFIERIFFNIALADRPMLLVAILLIVFGILSFAIGLVGELIIFTHAEHIQDYIVEEVIQKENSEREGEDKRAKEKIEDRVIGDA